MARDRRLCYISDMRILSRGVYLDAVVPDHPNADSRGRKYLHHIVVEKKIGRLVRKGEVVHHRNENKRDNSEENLEVLTRGAHTALHKKPLTLVPLVCAQCGVTFSRELRNVKHGSLAFCGKAHLAAYYVPKRGKKAISHGAATGYRRGCRCVLCRKAQTERVRAYRERKGG